MGLKKAVKRITKKVKQEVKEVGPKIEKVVEKVAGNPYVQVAAGIAGSFVGIPAPVTTGALKAAAGAAGAHLGGIELRKDLQMMRREARAPLPGDLWPQIQEAAPFALMPSGAAGAAAPEFSRQPNALATWAPQTFRARPLVQMYQGPNTHVPAPIKATQYALAWRPPVPVQGAWRNVW